MTPTELLLELGACDQAREWAAQFKTLAQAWCDDLHRRVLA